jgi:hypothetical protein
VRKCLHTLRIRQKYKNLIMSVVNKSNVRVRIFLEFFRKLKEQTTVFSAHRKYLEEMNRVVQDSSRYVA